ncbi:formate dehydrogenase-N subunit alpha [Pseudodesulfovibrio sp. F-1]|uniref:Formate dehydrogenase-N subunit alpha n=1 Tax=Pseudodesulfovibrio alkaliphilus TaxID=2661613 RepID=A0A7K1KKG6_9BACT|nr:formate dehydrogenase-N subunit alpha [Pseudodesulfovibrio alkaliphilus]MUM76530.1 formate dehydrogenase-N subunit alpha [Pseudodesulfovibrio alkaliphilus]
MKINRRRFLKLTAATAVGAAFSGLGFVPDAQALDRVTMLDPKWSRQTTSICPYCGVGCGLIVNTDLKTKRAINTEGDPDHPINEGSTCAKGASIWQLAENDERPPRPRYRAPYSTEWKEVSWEWALGEIAKRVKQTRDATFAVKNAKGQVVNRCNGIASVGSAAIDNEECWAYQSILRSLGLVYIEHQARICHSSTVPALAESFGRGAMTNHWNDIANSDCVLVMGSNAAENHPISFKWVTRAMHKGAKLINLDPRFTRTSSRADLHCHIRAGTDIAILGGLIKYILDNDLIQKDYVLTHTNGSTLVGEKFGFNDGLFTGYTKNGDDQDYAGSYDKSQWAFERDANGLPRKDPSLKHPRCVINLLRKHYERYDIDTVSSVSGADKQKLLEFYKLYSATGKPDKAGTILYAMGWTQHTVGVQYIRTMAMVQLLLGNIGVAGGGVNAMRGESNVQGSTDHALLWHLLPGYLATPNAGLADYKTYIDAKTKPHLEGAKDPMSAAWWQNTPKYMASFLKAMYPAATAEQAYAWLPKAEDGKTYTWLQLFDAMSKGEFKGFFAWGMNPACGGANAGKNRKAMANLDWMVNVNIFDNETGSFWRGPGQDPKKIKTEVFFLPCAVSIEKEGSIINSGRWMQWRYEGPVPRGESKSDGHIMTELYDAIRALYEKEGGALPEPIKNLSVDMWKSGHDFDPHKVARLINGHFTRDVTIDGKTYKKGTQVPSFALLQDDGSTASGNWLYCNSYTESGNMAARRSKEQTPEQANIGLFPNWAWCWPVNRRILYNRASCDNTGKPYAPQKAVVRWDGGKWIGDVPDGGWAPGAKYAFIMQAAGLGQLYGPGREDGPFPEHYEPMETPFKAHSFSKELNNPAVLRFAREALAVADPKYPLVATTFRVTEHWQTGHMTRHTPWLLEAMPQIFVEMSEELAREKGIANGEKVMVESIRGSVWAVAMVTKRLRPLTVMGRTTHQIGLPWHFGWQMPHDGSGGDSANLLTPAVGDPNTGIPETKVFVANVRKL